MARRKVIWHIGPADAGTEFLSDALAAARDPLAQRGIGTPAGPWHEIEDQIWAHRGTSLMSTPRISRADQAKVALRLNGLRDLEVHLVLLVRDLPTQVYAAWQSGLQHGSTTPLAGYAARVLDPERRHWQAEEFWAGHDLARILPLWTRAFHPDRVHVVAAPADADGLWDRLLELAGVFDVRRPQTLVPPTLTAELDPGRVLDITTEWAKLVADRGFDLHGSLVAAATTAAPATEPRQLEALAELLAATTGELERLSTEMTRLRAENERLDRKRRKHKRKVAELTGVGV